MKGKINEEGYLELLRGNVYRPQGGPFDQSGSYCGDWCALFCEPVEVVGNEIELNLCHTFHVFKKEDFKDER